MSSSKTKVIIPIAGIGSRLRPQTHTQPKAMVSVAGKPLIAHIVDNLIEHDFDEYIFVIGHFGNKVEQYIREEYRKLKKSFVVQAERKGVGHAIFQANKLIAEEDAVFIVLGDTIFDVDLKPVLSSQNSMLGVKKVDDPRSFGVAEMNDDGVIKKLVEKPSMPKSNQALIGVYKVLEGRLLMDSLKAIISNNKKTNGEYQLTDGLMNMISKGVKFNVFDVDKWYDCGNKSSLLETNELLLKRGSKKAKNYPFTIIIPPVSIHPSVQIEDSIIGPNVTIGEKTDIRRSVIKNSIIGSFSSLDSIILEDTLLGSDCSLKGSLQSLNVGDNTDIHYS